ncbi:hypothetical protein BV25DRAFT_1831552 [Artomyces pyxidatus]|uniref:Uncharacterized protein n=1 Tax=Artomyces pyxidatus TaxID=48021 RepID=A0ACB8SKF8_9AGAM|nr:hypothetical protein BV25DRAFT_1831552 [Artomyces pyxidatus]
MRLTLSSATVGLALFAQVLSAKASPAQQDKGAVSRRASDPELLKHVGAGGRVYGKEDDRLTERSLDREIIKWLKRDNLMPDAL